MKGFRHQVAGHVIWEGMLLEGLAVERAGHDRYHAARRNPGNEIEFGDHDACSIANCGVYFAACELENFGPKQHIGFAPKLTPENFKCAFTSAEGWKSLNRKSKSEKPEAEIAVRWGILTLQSVAPAGNFGSAKLWHAETRVAAKLKREGKRILPTLKKSAQLSAKKN